VLKLIKSTGETELIEPMKGDAKNISYINYIRSASKIVKAWRSGDLPAVVYYQA
jgi:hypothetical protein